MSALKFRPGDRVHVESEGVEGVVVDVKTHSVVVRIATAPDETYERHLKADDLELLPTTKEAALIGAEKTGSPPLMVFAVDPTRWLCIDDAHVRGDRVAALISALHTLYGNIQPAGILQTVNLVGFHGRRVMTISWIAGHDVFHRMQSAWNDHRVHNEHLDVAEARTFDVYRVLRVSGRAALDESDSYVNVFVSVKALPAELPAFRRSASALLDGIKSGGALKGGALFGNDDDSREMLFTRWAGRHEAETFVQEVRQHVVLPATAQLGDEAESYALEVHYTGTVADS